MLVLINCFKQNGFYTGHELVKKNWEMISNKYLNNL